MKYPFLTVVFHPLKSDTHSSVMFGDVLVVNVKRFGADGIRDSSQAVRINLKNMFNENLFIIKPDKIGMIPYTNCEEQIN